MHPRTLEKALLAALGDQYLVDMILELSEQHREKYDRCIEEMKTCKQTKRIQSKLCTVYLDVDTIIHYHHGVLPDIRTPDGRLITGAEISRARDRFLVVTTTR